ncbi:MAG: hypothetical protein KatS3mg114_0278 [Planctomycetaceae bacterium]|nr:MAG: hypothetical protein KatS3mg114_0278 [Planctomycetaceae bacterium]
MEKGRYVSGQCLKKSSGLVLMLWVLSGCGGDRWTRNLPDTVPAQGVVTLDGKPVDGASIVFVPADGGKYTANGLSRSDGSFALRAFPSKQGVVPGSYKIGVSKTVEQQMTLPQNFQAGEDAEHAQKIVETNTTTWVNALPQKYASPETSGLMATIPPEGIKDLKLELTSQ